MASLLHIIPALDARRALGDTTEGIHWTIQRLALGLPPHGSLSGAIPLEAMHSWLAGIRMSHQGRRQAKDGLAFLRACEATLNELTKLLERAWGLAHQAQSPDASDIDRSNLDAAYQSIRVVLERTVQETGFNGEPLFGAARLHVSLDEGNAEDIDLGTLRLDLPGDLRTLAGAHGLIQRLAEAQNTLNASRSKIELGLGRLAVLANNLGVQGENFAVAQSQLRDIQLADSAVNLAKFQILNHSGHSPLGNTAEESAVLVSLLH